MYLSSITDLKINILSLLALLGNFIEHTNTIVVILVSVSAILFNSIRFYEIYKRIKDKRKNNG